jgi:hypothetical protein
MTEPDGPKDRGNTPNGPPKPSNRSIASTVTIVTAAVVVGALTIAVVIAPLLNMREAGTGRQAPPLGQSATGARANSPPAAAQGRPARRAFEGHGWAVLSGGGESTTTGKPVLMHVPPRRGPGAPESGGPRASRGRATGVWRMDAPPVAIAAWDAVVHVAMPPVPRGVGLAPGERRSAVVEVSARRGDRRSRATWSFPPGRPVDRAALLLSRSQRIIAMAGTGLGPAALMGSDDGRASAGDPLSDPLVELRVLASAGWQRCALPTGLVYDSTSGGSVDAHVDLVGTRTGVQLWRWSGEARESSVTVFRGELGASSLDVVGPPVPLVWTQQTWPIGNLRQTRPDSSKPDGMFEQRAVLGLGETPGEDVPVLVDRQRTTMVVHQLGPGGQRELGRINDVPVHADVSISMLPASDAVAPMLAVAWRSDPVDATGRTARGGIELRELSLATGQILFAGKQVDGSSILRQRMEAVAAGLVMLLIIIASYVFRKESVALGWPAGWQAAGPVRRVLAGAFDLLVALGVSLSLLGRGDESLFAFGGLVRGEWHPDVWGLTLAVGAILGTIAEALWGRTLGKFMVDCKVADARAWPGAGVWAGKWLSTRPRTDQSPADPRQGSESARDPRDHAGPTAPTWGQAAIRNAIRWLLPGSGLVFMLDREGRHVGDACGGTAVMCAVPPPSGSVHDDA